MIRLQKAQVILAQSFFCPQAIECDTSKASKLLRSFQTFPIGTKINTTVAQYNDSNYFIPHFGQIRMYGTITNSPFTMTLISMASEPKKKELLSVCYGAQANYYIHATMIAHSAVKCLILPMIHFFPNRMVTILYSCYVESENEDIVGFVADLKKAFNGHRKDLLLQSSKKMPGAFFSFDDLTCTIQHKITHAIKEYDFENSHSSKYSFVHFLSGELGGKEFDRKVFCRLACTLTQSSMLNDEYVDEYRRTNWYGYTSFYYNYVTSREILYITDGAFDCSSKTLEKSLRTNGWQMFARLEFAQFDRMLLYYLTAKTDELIKYVQDDIRGESTSVLKLKIYDKKYEKLCRDYLNSLENTADSYARKVVYSCYGSKEKRQRLWDELREKTQQLQGMYGDRQSIYQRVFGALGTVADFVPGGTGE